MLVRPLSGHNLLGRWTKNRYKKREERHIRIKHRFADDRFTCALFVGGKYEQKGSNITAF